MRESRSVIKDGTEKMLTLNGLGQAAIQDVRFGKIHEQSPHAYIHTAGGYVFIESLGPIRGRASKEYRVYLLVRQALKLCQRF